MTDQSNVRTIPAAASPPITTTTISVPEKLMLGHNADWWGMAMLWSLGFAALCAFAVVFTTAAVVKLQRQGEADAKRALETYKATVAGQIAEANKKGVEAGEAAGDALLRAAALEKEAQELKAENLALRMKIQPRRLTGEESRKLSAALSEMPRRPIGIVSRIFDPEGADFADDLSIAFDNAHWEAVRQRDWTMSNKGVAIATFEGTSISPHLATALIAALATANIKATVITISASEQNTTSAHFQPDVLYLLVGAKP
jgi:hypothetical protein